jgi:hypothetical protein
MIKYIHEVVTRGDYAVGFALVWHASSVWNVAVKKSSGSRAVLGWHMVRLGGRKGMDGGVKGRHGVGLDWGSTGWFGLWSGSWSLIWTRKAFYEFMNMDFDILGRAEWNMNFFLQLFFACISFHSGTSLNLLKPTS